VTMSDVVRLPSAVLHSVPFCSAPLCSSLFHSTPLCSAPLHSALLCSALHCTALHISLPTIDPPWGGSNFWASLRSCKVRPPSNVQFTPSARGGMSPLGLCDAALSLFSERHGSFVQADVEDSHACLLIAPAGPIVLEEGGPTSCWPENLGQKSVRTGRGVNRRQRTVLCSTALSATPRHATLRHSTRSLTRSLARSLTCRRVSRWGH
jgi:hypothetical protein